MRKKSEISPEEKAEKVRAVKTLRREEHGVGDACKAVSVPRVKGGRSPWTS